MPFRNRSEAGRRLALALAGYKEQEPTILALPRGGVAVAAEVAAALDAALDLILVRKVGVPFQPELAMGAVADAGPRSDIDFLVSLRAFYPGHNAVERRELTVHVGVTRGR